METSSESLRVISRASVIGRGGMGWTKSALWSKEAALIWKWSTFWVFRVSLYVALRETESSFLGAFHVSFLTTSLSHTRHIHSTVNAKEGQGLSRAGSEITRDQKENLRSGGL